MITVYVLVTFYDENGIHYAGTICKVKAENFDSRFMKKVKSPSEYVYSKTEVDEMMLAKQDLLTEGTGIDIDEDEVISCTVAPTSVSVTQVQSTGTKIATITVDSTDTDIYAPSSSGGIDGDVIADEFDTTGTVTPPAGTLYNAGDVVKRSSNYYSCKNDNTQSGTWSSAKWTQLTVTTVSAPGADIDKNAYALDSTNNKLYLCNPQWTAQAWFTPGNPSSDFVEVTYTTYDTTPYSPGGTVYVSYSVGDYVIYEDELYKCVSSTTGGTWVPAKWSNTQVMDEAGGSTVSVTQVQSTGTKIATITVDSVDTDIYAPSSGGGGGFTVLSICNTQGQPIEWGEMQRENKIFDGTNFLNFNDVLTLVNAGPVFVKDMIGNGALITSISDDTFLLDLFISTSLIRNGFTYYSGAGVWMVDQIHS